MRELNFRLIGNNVRERRKELGFTQEYVAGLLDVNPSHISNVERGFAKPSLTLLVALANVLMCSVDAFLSHEYLFNKPKEMSHSDLDAALTKKLNYCSYEKKQRILQMIDLL